MIRLLVFCFFGLAVIVVTVDSLFAGTPPERSDMFREFSQSFEKADSMGKRELVIGAIDKSLIKRGISFDETKLMFGSHLQVRRRDSHSGTITAVVFFEPVHPSSDPMVSALQAGWYIDLVFTSDLKLSHYSLSNLHK